MAPPAATSGSDMRVKAATDTQLATLQSDRLSINGVSARRSKAPQFGGGIAAHTSSDMYKCPGYGKPKAKRWDHRLSEESKARKPNALKGAAKYLSKPGLISLGGGLPSSQYFPIEHIDIKVPTVPHFSETETKELGLVQRIGKHDIAEGKSIYDLHVGLNYGQATGSAQILRFVTEHTEMVHNPPYRDWQCSMDVGSTSGLDLALRMFVTRGDYILTEEYVYSSAAEAARPLGARWIGLPMDAEGIISSKLDDILSNWDPETHNGKAKPFLLYTIPSGQNPTGATQSLKRRREIYRVAQKHDLYIIEDEPYFFLQMPPYEVSNAQDQPPASTHEDLLRSLIPSYLALDIDGRVMRLDSFAKVIAPGMRTGWITASTQVVERFIRNSEVAVQNPSGPSQLILFKLLDETWGHAGYLSWLLYIRGEYTKRRNNIVQACDEFLPREVASWNPPMAGMFHWIQIDWKKHPGVARESMLEIEDEVYLATIEKGALVCKGSWFRAEDDDAHAGELVFFRTTFAASPADQVREAIRRFGEALRESFALDQVTSGSQQNGDAK